MDFKLTEEQKLLRDSARRFVEREYGFEARRKLVEQGGGFSRAHWATFAEMGWLGLGVPEALGGMAASMVDVALVMEEFGRGLVVEPFVASAVLATEVLRQAGSAAQQAQLLTPMAEGALIVAPAYSEPQARGALQFVTTQARAEGAGFVLDGRKTAVVGAPFADRFIVSARTAGAPDADTGLQLFVVDAKAAGVRVHGAQLIDGSWGGDVVLDGVQVGAEALLDSAAQALPVLEAALERAIVSVCAESVGAMEKAIELTAEYVKTRRQFGVAIGSFQALQHRLADMAIELEMARSMLYRGLAALEMDDAHARRAAVSASKFVVAKAAKFVCGQAIQLHGGIGMTEEYAVGHYFKRMVAAEMQLGNADVHLNRYTDWLQAGLRATA